MARRRIIRFAEPFRRTFFVFRAALVGPRKVYTTDEYIQNCDNLSKRIEALRRRGLMLRCMPPWRDSKAHTLH